jgi:hypothetical protein
MDSLKPAEIERFSILLSLDPTEVSLLPIEAVRLMASEAYLKKNNPEHKSLLSQEKILSLFPAKER